MSAREALVTYERARYSSQLSVVEGWLGPLRDANVRADASAFRTAWDGNVAEHHGALRAQLRADLERDAIRLEAAAAGRSRSAVPTGTADDLPSTAAFAADQAHHIAQAVHRFARKAATADTDTDVRDAIERAQRWTQRLRWELLDTHCRDQHWDTALAEGMLELRATRTSLAPLLAFAQAYAVRTRTLMVALRKPPLSPDTDETTTR